MRLLTGAGMVDAKVVQVDAADDLALLKADGRFACLPILPSKAIQLGSTVATIGFPDPGLQGFAPKVLAHGHQCVGTLAASGVPPRRDELRDQKQFSVELSGIGAGRGGGIEKAQYGG